MSKLRQKYKEQVETELLKELKITNVMDLPRLEKIVINVGLGEALKNAAAMERVVEDLGVITGQRPVIAKAKKSISNFSLREGDKIGSFVTLRGQKAWDFLDRFPLFLQ